MRTRQQMTDRIDELKTKILFIEQSIQREMEKNFDERDYVLLKFLDREQSIYQFGVLQIEWILSDSESTLAGGNHCMKHS